MKKMKPPDLLPLTDEEGLKQVSGYRKRNQSNDLQEFNFCQQVCSGNVAMFANKMAMDLAHIASDCPISSIESTTLDRMNLVLTLNSPYTELLNFQYDIVLNIY